MNLGSRAVLVTDGPFVILPAPEGVDDSSAQIASGELVALERAGSVVGADGAPRIS